MPIPFALRPAHAEDLPAWVGIARAVRHTMMHPTLDTDPAFLHYAARKLRQGEAFAAMEGDDPAPVGIVGFSRKYNRVTWLGVLPSAQSRGIGAALLASAIAALSRQRPITVHTYRPDYAPGQPALRLYARMGFVPTANGRIEEGGLPMAELSLAPGAKANLNVFMMCHTLRQAALRPLPAGFHFRLCRPDEVEAWKRLQVDDPADWDAYDAALSAYFADVYAPHGDLFFQRCTFVCDAKDTPVGACFVWPTYPGVHTIHWLKVRADMEGLGLGRALLSHIMRAESEAHYPIYLHTHPSCDRAIKLYSDLGFALLDDYPMIGHRSNDLAAALPLLRAQMPPQAFDALRIQSAPRSFLSAAAASAINAF